MSRLLYQAELHRRATARPGLATGPVVDRTSPFTESNRRPSPYHGDALPTELKGRAQEPSETLPDDPRPPCRDPARACEWRGAAEGPRPSHPWQTRASLRTGPCSGADEQPAVGGARPGGPDPGAGEQPGLQPVVRQRPADQEALQLVAAHLGQQVAGELVLDTLGHDPQPEVVRELDDRARDERLP